MSASTTPSRPAAAGGRNQPGVGRRVAVAFGLVALLLLVTWLAFSGGRAGDGPGGAVDELSHVHGLQIPTWGDGDVFVATHQGVFRIGEDAWSWVSQQPHDYMGFAAHPTDAGVLYSSGHPAPGSDLANPIGFMVSTDAGATWEPRSLQGEVDFHAMAVHPEDGEVIYGYDGQRGLLRTTDAGNTWQALPAPSLGEAGVTSLAVGAGEGVLYAGTEAGLLRSSDAGESWAVLIEAPVTAVRVDTSDPERLVAYVAAGDQGLLLSEDSGASWQPLGLVLDGDAAGHVGVDPSDPDIIWVGTFGESLWHTTDGGQSWKQVIDEGGRQ